MDEEENVYLAKLRNIRKYNTNPLKHGFIGVILAGIYVLIVIVMFGIFIGTDSAKGRTVYFLYKPGCPACEEMLKMIDENAEAVKRGGKDIDIWTDENQFPVKKYDVTTHEGRMLFCKSGSTSVPVFYDTEYNTKIVGKVPSLKVMMETLKTYD